MRWWRFAKRQILAWRDGYPDFAVYRTLLRQERLTAGEIEALRLAKARRLVDECLRNVPYYRDLLRQAGITAESVRSPRDLEVLPLLNKVIIRKQGRRLLNQAAPSSSYFAHTTGGSTGMPLDFYRGYEYDKLANAAANMRAFTRMGWSPGDRLARVWAPHDHEEQARDLAGRFRRGVRRWLDGDVTFSAYESSPQDMERWLPRMRAFRPQFLYGYATNLTLFARFLQRQGVRIDGVRGIASTALALFPNDRTLLKEVFPGVTVIDLYGSREITGIASECALGTMHINTDLVHVEHLPVPEEPGAQRLVITALDNTIFPFIRYDIGDYGAASLTRCRCGLPFPAMQWGTGKVLDSFVSPEGRIMAGGFFEDLIYGSHGIHAYQFRQRSETEIVLFIVPADDFDESSRAHFTGVEAAIRSQFSPQARLRVETVESIPLTPAGKHRFVVSDVRNPLSNDGDGGLPSVDAPVASSAAEKAVRA